jgi:DNA gyrase/topoisomerase IV subunit A
LKSRIDATKRDINTLSEHERRLTEDLTRQEAAAEAILEDLERGDITEEQQQQHRADLEELEILIEEHKKKLEDTERRNEKLKTSLLKKTSDYSKAYKQEITAVRKMEPVATKERKAARKTPVKQAELVKQKAILEPYKSKLGKGKGGHVHKESADKFGDNSELEPYLTKYLRPSKYRNHPEEELSSSEESSGSDSEGPKKTGRGKKKVSHRAKKVIEDYEIIESQPKAEKGVLIEKKTRAKKGLGGKKPVHQARKESDLWFM